jgi:hypothetical protein
LYVVVEGNAAQWRPHLESLHREYFGAGRGDPLAPVHLQVVERATHDALARLAESGLLSLTQRGSRTLFPDGANAVPREFTSEQQARLAELEAIAARKIRMARVLGEAGLDDEARAPLLDALLAQARSFAVQYRLVEPDGLGDAFAPPLMRAWGPGLGVFQSFAHDSSASWRAAIEALAAINPTSPV